MTENSDRTNGYDAWVAHVVAVARDGRTDRLRDILIERLTGRPSGEARHSPPLGRDEPDRSWILHDVYGALKRAGDAPDALGYFRRVLVELAEETIGSDDDDGLFFAVSWLIPECGVTEDPKLAARMERALWGYMTGLAPDLAGIASAGPEASRTVGEVFDLWLTTFSPDSDWPPPARAEQVRAMLDQTLRGDETAFADEGRMGWILMLFRALADLDPASAGREGLPALRCLWEHGGRLGKAEVETLLREYAASFHVRPAVAARFAEAIDAKACRAILERWREVVAPYEPEWLPQAGAEVVRLDDHRSRTKIGPRPKAGGRNVCFG